MKNTLRKIKLFCSNNKSYILIFVIFSMMFLFGKNFANDDYSMLQIKEIKRLSSFVEKKYQLDQGQQEVRVENIVSMSKDAGYRVFFDASAKKGASINEDKSQKVSAEIVLVSNTGEEKLLATINLESDKTQQNIENIFWADKNYTDLLIRKKDLSFGGSIVIKNIQVFPLSLKEQSQIQELKSSEVGNSNFTNIIQSSWSEKPNNTHNFLWKDQKIGQVFTAQSNVISSVDLSLKFLGVGGIGNYVLELYEYDEGNKQLSDRISYFYFSKNVEDTVSDYAITSKENVYHLPLASNVTKGKQYVLLLNNKSVSFNWLNTMKIYGQKQSYENNSMIYVIRDKIYQINGSLNFKIFGAEYSQYQGEKILSNAIISDLGNGHGVYSYKQNGDFSCFLDIYEYRDVNQNKTIAYYNNTNGGVLMGDDEGNYFTYKINTFYPFSRAYISLQKPAANYSDSKVYYSFDNANWQNAETVKTESTEENINNNVGKIIIGDGSQRVIYLKVVSDNTNSIKVDSTEEKIESFGMKDLHFTADLLIK